jgi:phosphoserine phosphatase
MSDPVPLVVDLDGTLVDADTLHLSIARLARERPWLLPALPFMVLFGRARFKDFVSDHVQLDPSSLPYRPDVMEFVKHQRASGRRIVLATAANKQIADAVARHLGVFESVIASNRRHNAKAGGKVAAIRAQLGDGEFDYIGDSMADVPVFRAARRSYLVCPSAELTSTIDGGARIGGVFQTARRQR